MSSHSTSRYVPISTKMDNPALSGSSGDVDVDNASVEVAGGIPPTCSSQQLMPPASDTDSYRRPVITAFSGISRSQWFTVVVLCFVNLINYMDRFTIAGVLTDIQDDFRIGDDEGGLLQTAFVLSYMICAPLFGYLGDRYSRRWIMAVGVLLWSTTTIMGSFMHSYGWFLTFRALVGVGEASYSTIAPTIISDLFVNDMRSKMLAMFYFAIPVGSGFGYIVGSETAHFANNWRWALRVTPFLGIAAVLLILLTKEPERGESEGSHNLAVTTYSEDLKYLVKNRSFMLSTCGFTCVAFVTGALAWWGPKFMYLGIKLQAGNEDLTLNDIAFKFGAITMVAGILGVPAGPLLSRLLMKRFPNADPLLCAIGLLISAFLIAGAMILVSKYTLITFVLMFVGQLALNLNWAVVADILLYVVVPTRRSTAEAFQILISHAFGDAGSPYLVGVLSEVIKKHLRTTANAVTESTKTALESYALTLGDSMQNNTNIFNDTTNSYNATFKVFNDFDSTRLYEDDTILNKFKALQYSLFSTSFVEVMGGVFFLLTAAYILRDKQRASQAALGIPASPSPNDSESASIA